MCLVAFQKTFQKIFSGVWKRRRKTQIRKHKPQPRKKKNHQRRKCFQSDDCAIDGAIEISPSSRDHDRRRDRNLREIAIDEAISRRSRSRLRDLGLELEQAISDWIFSSCARARALSLFLIFWKCFEGKIEV